MPKITSRKVLSSFSTTLIRTDTGISQIILATIGKNEALSLDNDSTLGGKITWLVMYKGKEVGRFIKDMQANIDKKYNKHYYPIIKDYSVIEENSGNYKCKINVDICIDE